MKNQKTMGNKGFSLVELIVVIAIMAVLVGVLAPQFIKYVENSRQSTDMQNVQEIKTAIEVYVAEKEGDAGTITINTNGGTLTLSDDAKTAAGASGAGDITTLKSNGWKDVTYTYSTTDYKWTPSETSNINGKGKKTNDMNSVFK